MGMFCSFVDQVISGTFELLLRCILKTVENLCIFNSVSFYFESLVSDGVFLVFLQAMFLSLIL